MDVNVTPIENSTRSQWQCGEAGGVIWRTDAGFIADSPSVIVDAGRGPFSATAEVAARSAYYREVMIAPALADVARKYRIEHPATAPAVYAVVGGDRRVTFDGEPAPDGRYANLMPWERELTRVARTNASLTIMLKDGDTVTLAAVGGRFVHLFQLVNGEEARRWRVEDGARKVALFLA